MLPGRVEASDELEREGAAVSPVMLHARYSLGEVIGRGGFGVTRAAYDTVTGAQVVIKELTIKCLPDWKPVEHFDREVKVLRAIDHPGVPALIDAFEDQADNTVQLYIVTELVPGQDLSRCIEEGMRWDETKARALLAALLETLQYLHGLSPQIIHRDIKPGNIVLRPDGRPVLVDFGAVRDLATGADGPLTVLGTPGYMAPEQALGNADARSDLFALGATMLHVLTHIHPTKLPRKDMRLQFDEIVGLPGLIRKVLARLTEPDPAARFQTAGEALDALMGRTPPEPSTFAPVLAESSVSSLAPTPRRLTPAIREHLSTTRALRKATPAALGAIASAIGLFTILGILQLPVGYLVPAMGLVLFALFVLMKSAELRNRRLYRDGAKTTGSVTGSRKGLHGVVVSYTYEIAGQRYRGELVSTSDAEVPNALQPGLAVVVFYDRAHPKQHLAFCPPRLKALGEG